MRSSEAKLSCRSGGTSKMNPIGIELGKVLGDLPLAIGVVQRIATKQEAWYFEYRPPRAEEPALLAFRQWLHDEAKRQRETEAELMQRATKPSER